MSGHTPGPWEKNRFGELRGSNGKLVTVFDAGIAFGCRCDEYTANGVLMKAAPELLEALEQIESETSMNPNIMSKNYLKFKLDRLHQVARAAIAKAKVRP